MFNFSEIILDHFYSPRNVGEFSAAENYITATVSTPDKSTIMQMQIKLDSQKNKIIAAKFKAFGCPGTIAVASWLTVCLENKTLAEAEAINTEFLIKSLDLPKEKYYCGLLGEDLIKALIVKPLA